MNAMNRILIPLSAALVVWAAPLVALASPPHGEEAAHDAGHGAEHHVSEGIKWISNPIGGAEDGRTGFIIIIANFVGLFFILNAILFRGLRKMHKEKTDAIRTELNRATAARAEADALVKEYEAKLGSLETEVEDIRAAAKKTAAAEYDRILAEAKEQAEKIRDAGVRAAEREAARRRAELENAIVEQAVAKAEAAIRSSFGGADQRRLVDAWVAEVTDTQLGAN
ncbi:hypothetical protein PPSIR1_20449 [Plesiocystis pacifica SIR-1]|uniref:ATP synthase subunit b n=2 Tax=Plesiocystis pacifica TaxID=191768 RepID=A6G266_9BACT|nr:hypothetical protein PPSIR1_20449 [Plesiocystis pacifica SIR-1]